MAFSTTFRSWRTVAMTILANDNTNTGSSFTELDAKNIIKSGASRSKAGDLDLNLKSKALHKSAA